MTKICFGFGKFRASGYFTLARPRISL